MLLVVLLLVASVSGGGLVVSVNNHTCEYTSLVHHELKCPFNRVYIPVNKTNYMIECINQCVQSRGTFYCVSFNWNTTACILQNCKTTSSLNGTTAVTLDRDCFTPTRAPTHKSTITVTHTPTIAVTHAPTITLRPTRGPSHGPTHIPTHGPTHGPTHIPSHGPTHIPTHGPTHGPTRRPTSHGPTRKPTHRPTSQSPTTIEYEYEYENNTGSPTFQSITESPTFTTGSPTTNVTESPTTNVTGSPTFTTVSPTMVVSTGSPTTTSSNDYISPTGLNPALPVTPSLFVLVIPNTSLCMYVRPQPGSYFIQFNNFYGTQFDCMKECQYDTDCTGFIYGTDNVCIKAVSLELTDDINMYKQNPQWTIIYTLATYSLPYYNGYCSGFEYSSACDSEIQCAWDQGLRGYNQDYFTEVNGYCGRIECQ